jgi:hypothetical protein
MTVYVKQEISEKEQEEILLMKKVYVKQEVLKRT